MTSSTLSGNLANRGGGIGARFGSSVMITSSTLSGNAADGYFGAGGGIFADFGSALTVTSSTLSGNSANRGGGILTGGFGGPLTVTSSTLSGNSAKFSGGIYAGGQLQLAHSILAGNLGGGDLSSSVSTPAVTHSLIGDGEGSGLAEAPLGSSDDNGNLIGGPENGVIDPRLGPLADNGGPTWTHALLPNSPAIDMGDPGALAGEGEIPLFDQRGRPFARVVGGRIDMGAVEYQAGTLPGDLDGDNDVDSADLLAFIGNFTGELDPGTGDKTFAEGDLDLDGDVDSLDLLLFIGGWTGTLEVNAALAPPTSGGERIVGHRDEGRPAGPAIGRWRLRATEVVGRRQHAADSARQRALGAHIERCLYFCTVYLRIHAA